jgi:thiosulfate/3-mercaptopyruvate sulfurtransferase
MYTTLITPAQLLQLPAENVRIFDCSSDLMNREAADTWFAQTHIATAQQAHLDRNLSAQPGEVAASGGRHPLPSREAFATWLGQMGVRPDQQVVAYDRNGNAYAPRLWWMLKWLGHEAVAVLDGGLAAWQAAGGATAEGPAPTQAPSTFLPKPALATLKTLPQVHDQLGQPGQTLIDARAPARYRGETEPLDPIAGHIPGARNRLFSDNMQDGRFKDPAVLRQDFEALLDKKPAQSAVHYCGSGVTAAVNVLAMEIAGLGRQTLFAGSWSEWSRTPGMAVERG